MRAYTALPENKTLLDPDVTLSDRAIEAIAWRAWSAEIFFKVWTWLARVVDFERSHNLGQYYMEC